MGSRSLSKLKRPLQGLVIRTWCIFDGPRSHENVQQQYSVCPNSGRIEPGEGIQVQGKVPSFLVYSPRRPTTLPVLLQPMQEDPPLTIKCKDKFLVQSTFITPARESTPLDIVSTTAHDATSA